MMVCWAVSFGRADPLGAGGGAARRRQVQQEGSGCRWETHRPDELVTPAEVVRDGHEDLVAVLGSEPAATAQDGTIEAPGQLASHYAPGKPVRLNAQTANADEYHVGFGAIAGDINLSADGDLFEAAARLYACLHHGAESVQPRIAVAPVPQSGIGAAINDRLSRAAA